MFWVGCPVEEILRRGLGWSDLTSSGSGLRIFPVVLSETVVEREQKDEDKE